MRSRQLIAAAAAILLTVGLSGCDSKTGAAAVVDGHRITDSQVAGYLQPGTSQYKASGATVYPKTNVLQALLDTRLLGRALTAHGGAPSAAALNSAQAQVLQGTTRAAAEKYYAKYGYTAAFTDLLIHEQVLLEILGARVKASSSGIEIKRALDGLHARVSVSGRYGKWNPTTYSIDAGPSAGAPGFLTILSGGGASNALPIPAGS